MPYTQDGYVYLPVEVKKVGCNTMAVDLPANVAEHIFKVGSEGFQALMTDIGHNGAHIHHLGRAVALRKHDELGPVEGRSVSGVLATPVASPTTQQG